MNIVDSSAWLEYLADSSNAKNFAGVIEKTDLLLVPSLSLYEVFKRVYQQKGENFALQAVATMQQGRVVELSTSISLTAAKMSVELKLPMADSIMLATARLHHATLWTQDSDFEGIDEVRFFRKK